MFTDTWQIILKIRCKNKVNSFCLGDSLGKDIYLENLSHIKRWTSGKAEVFPRKKKYCFMSRIIHLILEKTVHS